MTALHGAELCYLCYMHENDKEYYFLLVSYSYADTSYSVNKSRLYSYNDKFVITFYHGSYIAS